MKTLAIIFFGLAAFANQSRYQVNLGSEWASIPKVKNVEVWKNKKDSSFVLSITEHSVPSGPKSLSKDAIETNGSAISLSELQNLTNERQKSLAHLGIKDWKIEKANRARENSIQAIYLRGSYTAPSGKRNCFTEKQSTIRQINYQILATRADSSKECDWTSLDQIVSQVSVRN